MRLLALLTITLCIFTLALGAPTPDEKPKKCHKKKPKDKSSKENCGPPNASPATLDLIKGFEGFRANPYWDVKQWAIGYGHSCGKDKSCSNTKKSVPISKDDAKDVLAEDVKGYVAGLNKCISNKVKLNPYQFGALVSWAYNMGTGAACDSSLVKRLNNGESINKVIESELPEWVHADGKVVEGLVNRRNKEIDFAKKKAAPYKKC